MPNTRRDGERRQADRHLWLAALACLAACLALALHYLLLLAQAGPAAGGGFATLRFLGGFTVLSNVLVALVTALALAAHPPRRLSWLTRAPMRGAAALYIGATIAIDPAVFPRLWHPAGAQWWADTLLHVGVPGLYLAWWAAGVAHGRLHARMLGRWLSFPLAFFAWVLVRGAWLHEYPYPILDVAVLGLSTVLRNAAGLLALFLGGAAFLLLVDRRLAAPAGQA